MARHEKKALAFIVHGVGSQAASHGRTAGAVQIKRTSLAYARARLPGALDLSG